MSKLPLGKNCFVTSITLPFLKKFGEEALEWDPYIVREAFETAFEVPKMPQRLFDKLNCGLTLIGTNAYTSTLEGFLSATACMNNLVLDADSEPFVDLTQCAWGVWEYMNLNGDVNKEGRPTEAFTPEISRYIQAAGDLNGITKFPIWLDFAEKPKEEIPDLSNDVTLFETYMARQHDYVADLTAYVKNRQKEMNIELLELKSKGFIG
jgi:hypothetical protein